MKFKISELFFEVAEAAPEETAKEWSYTAAEKKPEFTSREIQSKVNQQLNIIPKERERYMKQKWIRRITAMAAVMVMGSVTVFAAANVQWIKEFFLGDLSLVEDQVASPGLTVSDGEFKLTLEQVLADEHNAMLVFSTVPLTEEAKERIKRGEGSAMLGKGECFDSIPINQRNWDDYDMDDALFGWNMSVQPIKDSEIQISGDTMSMIRDKSTEDKQYWCVELNGLKNPKGGSVLLYPNKATNPKLFVEVSLKSTLKTRKIQLEASGLYNGQQYMLKKIDITPLGMTVEMEAPAAMKAFPEGELFFRMKDGTVKTKNQLSDLGSWSGSQNWNDEDGDDSKGTVVTQEGRFWEPLDPEDFESVIVEGVEYFFDSSQKIRAAAIDSSMQSFEFEPLVKDGVIVVPIEEMCERLNADLAWDKKTGKAVIRYRGLTLHLTIGSSEILRNGKVLKLPDPVEVYQGKLICNPEALSYGFNVGAERTNTESKNPYDWTWIITP